MSSPSDSPFNWSADPRRRTEAFLNHSSETDRSPHTPPSLQVALPCFGGYRDPMATRWDTSPVALRTQTFVQDGGRHGEAPALSDTPDHLFTSEPALAVVSPDKLVADARWCPKSAWSASLQTLQTMPYVPFTNTSSLLDEAEHTPGADEMARPVLSPVMQGAFSDVASSDDDAALRVLEQSPAPLPSLVEAASGIRDFDTPDDAGPLPATPRTPLDCLIAPPGVTTPAQPGLSLTGAPGLRSYTATPQLRSVFETPQKSTRRPCSRVGTPMRFGDKVERLNISLESHQPTNVSLRSAAGGPAGLGAMDTSVRSASEVAMAAAMLEGDHLTPNRNPFSPFRGYDAPYFMTSFDIRPKQCSPEDRRRSEHGCSSTRSGSNNSSVSSSRTGNGGDGGDGRSHRRAVRARRATSLPDIAHGALRPPAALVLCQQTLQTSHLFSPRTDTLPAPPPPAQASWRDGVASHASPHRDRKHSGWIANAQNHEESTPDTSTDELPPRLATSNSSGEQPPSPMTGTDAMASPLRRHDAGNAGPHKETPMLRGVSKETATTAYGLSTTPRTSERRLSYGTGAGLSPDGPSPSTGDDSDDRSLFLSARVGSSDPSPSPSAPGNPGRRSSRCVPPPPLSTNMSPASPQPERRILFAETHRGDCHSPVEAVETPRIGAADVPGVPRTVTGVLRVPLSGAVVGPTSTVALARPMHDDPLVVAGDGEASSLLDSLVTSTPAHFSATQRGHTRPTPHPENSGEDSNAEAYAIDENAEEGAPADYAFPPAEAPSPLKKDGAAAALVGSQTPHEHIRNFRFATTVFSTPPTGSCSPSSGSATAQQVPAALSVSFSIPSSPHCAGAAKSTERHARSGGARARDGGSDTGNSPAALRQHPLPALCFVPDNTDTDGNSTPVERPHISSPPPERTLFDISGDLSTVEDDDAGTSIRDGGTYGEYDETCDEMEPGDRFQMHHRFQFLHQFPHNMVAPPVFVPLTVDPTGVTWLAVHRLDGMPYAVKEVSDIHGGQLQVELQCLTLGNDPVTKEELQANAFISRYYNCARTPAAPVRQMNGMHASSAVSASTNVYLLQTEYFPRGSVWEYMLSAYRQACLSHTSQDGDGRPRCCFKEQHWVHLVEHTLKALEALHAHDIIHGNPLVHNVFVGDLDVFKLSNFGSAVCSPKAYPETVTPESLRPRYVEASPYEVDVGVFCNSVLSLFMALEHLEKQRRLSPSEEEDIALIDHLLTPEQFETWLVSVKSLAHLAVPQRLLDGLLAARRMPHTASGFLAKWLHAQTHAAFEACRLFNTELLRLALRYQHVLTERRQRQEAAQVSGLTDTSDASPLSAQGAPPLEPSLWNPEEHSGASLVSNRTAPLPLVPRIGCSVGRHGLRPGAQSICRRQHSDTSVTLEHTPVLRPRGTQESTHSLHSLDVQPDRIGSPFSGGSPYLSPPARLSAAPVAPLPSLQLPDTTARAYGGTRVPTTMARVGAPMSVLPGNGGTVQPRRTPRVVKVSSPQDARLPMAVSGSVPESQDHVNSTNSSRTHRSLFRSVPSLGSASNAALTAENEKARSPIPFAAPPLFGNWPSATLNNTSGTWRASSIGASPRDIALGHAAAQAEAFATDCLKKSLRRSEPMDSRESSGRQESEAELVGVPSRHVSGLQAGPRPPMPVTSVQHALLANACATMAMMRWDAIVDGAPRTVHASDFLNHTGNVLEASASVTSNSGHVRRAVSLEMARPLSSLE